MKKITLLINAFKDVEIKALKQKLDKMTTSERAEILFIQYQNKTQSGFADYSVFSIEDHDDVSFSQLLNAISTEEFLFFNPEINYPADFFTNILSDKEKASERIQGSVWEESIIAVQQSSYGLCEMQSKSTVNYSYLNISVLFNKKEVNTLNTDKLSVHAESELELYRYAQKKKLNLRYYAPKGEKVEYITHFADLMFACQKKAQKNFKLFPALFVLFFIIFGFGAVFNSAIFLIFLIGMSAYLMAITLEAFGLSTIKKNGGMLPILLFLFPFIHLVYGLESWMAKFNKKA